MDTQKFLNTLEEMMELDPNSLKATDSLEDTGMWDSMATLSFVSLADEQFGTTVSADALAGCQTPNDLMDLVGRDKFQG